MSMVWLLLLAAQGQPAAPPLKLPDRPAAYYHFSLAQQARMAGRSDEALEELRKAQQSDPHSGEIRRELALVLREAGRVEQALEEAQQAVRLEPDDQEAHLMLAQLLQSMAEAGARDELLGRAAAEYEEVLRLDPGDEGTLRRLAALYGQLGRKDDVERTWQRYLEADPGNVEAQLQLGALALEKGESARAAELFQQAAASAPTVQVLQGIGELYLRAEQYEQATVHFRKALELEPGNLRLHLSLGEALFRSRQNEEALKQAEAVLASDSRNRFAYDLKARALRELKRFDAADEAADQVVELASGQDRNDFRPLFLKVTIAQARGDFASAAQLLEQILSRDRAASNEEPEEAARNDRIFYYNLGYAYQRLGRHADAAAAFGKAKDADKLDPDVVGRYVDALVQAEQLDKALAEVRAARAKLPDSSELMAQEAAVLREKGDVDAALKLIEQMRSGAPDDLDTQLHAAEFYQRSKRYGDAEAVLRHARELGPDDVRPLFLLGAVLERQQRHDDAEAVFREALTKQPDFAPALNYLGYMNADRGVRLEEALSLIQKALALDPENGAYLDSCGWALYRLNRLEQAERYLRRAVAKESASAVVLDHLGDVLEKRGQVHEAIAYWRKALAGEDEDGELDRERVEHKIRKVETALPESAREPRH